MTSEELDLYARRLLKAVDAIGYERLLTLPKPIIEALQGTKEPTYTYRIIAEWL